MDFDFQCPTKIYFHNEGVSRIGRIIADDYHFNKVYFIYGGNSIKKNGTYEKIIDSLKESKIAYKEHSGIEANPDIEEIRTMVKEVKLMQPDLILACGGGSVIDSAKSVAHGYYYDGDPLDFNKHLVRPLHALPVATILTLVASGSEMSDSCVVSDRRHHFKAGFNSVTNYPLFSLLDPSLTLSVPAYQLGCGFADMFCHSFERYFSPSSAIEPCDGFALSIMHDIVRTSYAVLKNPNDISARRAMMIEGTLSHNGFTNYGKGKVFIVHKAEHILSGLYPQLTHGQGIALLMAEFLKVNADRLHDKIMEFGRLVFRKEPLSVAEVVEELEKWLDTLPIAHCYSDLPFEMKEEDIRKAEKVLKLK